MVRDELCSGTGALPFSISSQAFSQPIPQDDIVGFAKAGRCNYGNAVKIRGKDPKGRRWMTRAAETELSKIAVPRGRKALPFVLHCQCFGHCGAHLYGAGVIKPGSRQKSSFAKACAWSAEGLSIMAIKVQIRWWSKLRWAFCLLTRGIFKTCELELERRARERWSWKCVRA